MRPPSSIALRRRFARLRLAAVILALASAAACAPRRPTFAPLPACSPAPASTAGWETKDEDLFTFQIPSGLRHGMVRGIDSSSQTWTGRGLHISHNVGPYAGPSLAAGESMRNYVECTTMIDGVEAHVASWNTPRGGFMLHAAWRRMAPAGPFGDTNLAITVSTRSSDPQTQAIAHAVIHSVRFP